MITHGGFFFANTFWAEAEGCGSLKDQLKCLSVELCCLKHLEQLLLYFGSQQIRNWGSKDGSVADYRGLKIAGEPCVWCGGGWGSLEKVGGWDLTSFLYQRLARIHHTYIYILYIEDTWINSSNWFEVLLWQRRECLVRCLWLPCKWPGLGWKLSGSKCVLFRAEAFAVSGMSSCGPSCPRLLCFPKAFTSRQALIQTSLTLHLWLHVCSMWPWELLYTIKQISPVQSNGRLSQSWMWLTARHVSLFLHSWCFKADPCRTVS